jgi:antitoxin CcdA
LSVTEVLMGKAELKLEIDERLLAQAKAADVSLEAALEAGVRQALDQTSQAGVDEADRRAALWAVEQAGAINDYNQRIERRGVFGADLRRW